MSAWWAVALADSLAPGTSAGTRVHGQEFVVWRDSAGASHVWEDRCPHRGMRLSFGFVRGGHIACLYHGWQFDHEGQCRLIPAHPEVVVPKTIKATRYASVERLGMIWLHIQDGDDGQPPEDIARVTSVRTLAIEAPPELVATHLSPNARSPHDVTRQDVDGLPVIMVLQPLSTQETALHLVIHGQHGPDAQKRVAVWGMGLRARLEALAR